MTKKSSCFLFFCHFILVFVSVKGQDTISSVPISFNPAIRADPIAIIDNDKNSILLFTNTSTVRILKYDKDFNLIYDKSHYKESGSASKTLGYWVDSENTTHIFFSDLKVKKLLIMSIDQNENVSKKEYELDVKDEKFIEAFTIGNSFHILTYTKDSSIINRYSFVNNDFLKVSYNLFAKNFCEKVNGVCSLKNVFKKNEIQFISNNTPTTLGQSANKLKLYPDGQNIVIVADHRLGTSVLIRLSLTDDHFDIDYFGNDYSDFKEYARKRSNSFLFKDHLFQIIASKRKGRIFIKKLATKEVIQKFEFNRDYNIAFNNSEIYQDKGSFSLKSERIRDTKKFLAEMMEGNIALTVEEKYGKLYMVFGSYGTYSISGPGFGLPVASFGSVTFFMGAFYSVSNSQATYTRSLLDPETFKNVEGFAGINIFELIKVFKDEEAVLKNVIRENIYKYDDFYIYGYYDTKTENYTLLKF